MKTPKYINSTNVLRQALFAWISLTIGVVFFATLATLLSVITELSPVAIVLLALIIVSPLMLFAQVAFFKHEYNLILESIIYNSAANAEIIDIRIYDLTFQAVPAQNFAFDSQMFISSIRRDDYICHPYPKDAFKTGVVNG